MHPKVWQQSLFLVLGLFLTAHPCVAQSVSLPNQKCSEIAKHLPQVKRYEDAVKSFNFLYPKAQQAVEKFRFSCSHYLFVTSKQQDTQTVHNLMADRTLMMNSLQQLNMNLKSELKPTAAQVKTHLGNLGETKCSKEADDNAYDAQSLYNTLSVQVTSFNGCKK